MQGERLPRIRRQECNLPVQRLRRVSIGGVSDPRLPKGAFRELDQREIVSLSKRRKKASKR